jgi:hypothetical protein
MSFNCYVVYIDNEIGERLRYRTNWTNINKDMFCCVKNNPCKPIHHTSERNIDHVVIMIMKDIRL